MEMLFSWIKKKSTHRLQREGTFKKASSLQNMISHVTLSTSAVLVSFHHIICS